MKHNVSEISVSLSSLNSFIHTYLLDFTELVFREKVNLDSIFVNVSVWRNRVSLVELALGVIKFSGSQTA